MVFLSSWTCLLFSVLPQDSFCRESKTSQLVLEGVMSGRASKQNPLANPGVVHRDSDDSAVLVRNFDIVVKSLSWFTETGKVVGIRFNSEQLGEEYYTPDGSRTLLGQASGTFVMPANEWFVKATFTHTSMGLWESFQFITNKLKVATAGNTSGLTGRQVVERLAAPCRQIFGITFKEGRVSGVRESMRPFFLKDLSTVEATPKVQNTSAERKGTAFGCGSRLKTKNANTGPLYCNTFGDPHYNPGFFGSTSMGGTGVYWTARAIAGKKFALQEASQGYGTLAFKMMSGRNLIYIGSNGVVTINGERAQVENAYLGFFYNCINDVDGDASIFFSGGNHRVWFDPAALDRDVGRCLGKNTPVPPNEILFTKAELVALGLGVEASFTGPIILTAEQVCQRESVPYNKSIAACNDIIDKSWNRDCQFEFCGDKENKEVTGYIMGEKDSSICAASKLTMEICIPLDHTRLAATKEIEMESLRDIVKDDWFTCEETCAATLDCLQAVYDRDTKICRGYSNVTSALPNMADAGFVSSVCREGRYQWARRSQTRSQCQVVDVILRAVGIILFSRMAF